MTNPLAAALNLIGAQGFADYDLIPGAWWVMGGFCVVSLAVLIIQVLRLSRPR